MFTPTSMRKVNIFVREEDIERATVALMRLEALDLRDSEPGEGWESARRTELAETYADLTRRFAHLLDALEIDRQNIAPLKRLEPDNDVDYLQEHLQEAEPVIQDWHARHDDARAAAEQLRRLLQEMDVLEPLDVSVERLCHLRYLYLYLYLYLSVGTLPSEGLESLQIALFRIPFVLIPVHEYQEDVLIVAAAKREHAAILDRALRSAFFDPLELPDDVSGSPTDARQTLQARLDETQQHLDELERERQQLVQEWQTRLLALWQQARNNERVAETIDNFNRHGNIYLITGWLPARDLDALIETVDDATDGRADVEVLDPDVVGERQAPTQLRNPSFLRPFETIVSTFGFPTYDELDPTALVAVSFVLMYGMMFGDVGHGLLLALVLVPALLIFSTSRWRACCARSVPWSRRGGAGTACSRSSSSLRPLSATSATPSRLSVWGHLPWPTPG